MSNEIINQELSKEQPVPRAEIPDQLESKQPPIENVDEALKNFSRVTELTPDQQAEATEPEKEELTQIDREAEKATAEAKQEINEASSDTPELPKGCEVFFDKLTLGDLQNIKVLYGNFEKIFTDSVMEEIKIDLKFKKETASRYFNALMEQVEQTLQIAVAEIENSKKHARAKQEATEALHGIVGGGTFALAHKGVSRALLKLGFKVGTSASAPLKIFLSGGTFAFVSGFNHLVGRGCELVSGKKIPRLAKKLEEGLEEQGQLEVTQKNLAGVMKGDLAILMNYDKNRQGQLGAYQKELKNLKEEDLAKIFSGKDDQKHSKQQQLIELIQKTQDIKSLSAKEQKTAIQNRRELMKKAIDSNALDEFITYQMTEEAKKIKIDLAKDGQVALTPQMENQIIMRASQTVRGGIDAVLAEAVLGEKDEEIEKAGKSFIEQSFFGKFLGKSEFVHKVWDGFLAGAFIGVTFDAGIGPICVAWDMAKDTLKNKIVQYSKKEDVIKTSSEIYNEVFLAAKSDKEIKRMIGEKDAQSEQLDGSKDLAEIKMLNAEKKRLEQTLDLKAEEIQEIIKTAKAQSKASHGTSVETAKIGEQIKKLETKFILKSQLEELKNGNDQMIRDLSEQAKDIIQAGQQGIAQAVELTKEQKKTMSLIGLFKRFWETSGQEKKDILKATGWSALKAHFFATVGTNAVKAGEAAYKGEKVSLGGVSADVFNQVSFGLGGKMLAGLKGGGVAEAASSKNVQQQKQEIRPKSEAQSSAGETQNIYRDYLEATKEVRGNLTPKELKSLKKIVQSLDGNNAKLSASDVAKAVEKNKKTGKLEIKPELVRQAKGEFFNKKYEKVLNKMMEDGKISKRELQKLEKIATTKNEKALNTAIKNYELNPNEIKRLQKESKEYSYIDKNGEFISEIIHHIRDPKQPFMQQKKVTPEKSQNNTTSPSTSNQAKPTQTPNATKHASTPDIAKVKIEGKIDSIWDVGKKIGEQLGIDFNKFTDAQGKPLAGEALEAKKTYVHDAIKDAISKQMQAKGRNPNLVKNGETINVDVSNVQQHLKDRHIIEKQLSPKEVKNILENNAKIKNSAKKRTQTPQEPEAQKKVTKQELTPNEKQKLQDTPNKPLNKEEAKPHQAKPTEEFKLTTEKPLNYSKGKHKIPENLSEVDIFIEDEIYKVKTAPTPHKAGGLTLWEQVGKKGNILGGQDTVLEFAENINKKLTEINGFKAQKDWPKGLSEGQVIKIIARDQQQLKSPYERGRMTEEIKTWDKKIKGRWDLITQGNPEQIDVARYLVKNSNEPKRIVRALEFTKALENAGNIEDFAKVAARKNPNSLDQGIMARWFGLNPSQFDQAKVVCNGQKLTIKNVRLKDGTPIEIVVGNKEARIGSTYYKFGKLQYIQGENITSVLNGVKNSLSPKSGEMVNGKDSKPVLKPKNLKRT